MSTATQSRLPYLVGPVGAVMFACHVPYAGLAGIVASLVAWRVLAMRGFTKGAVYFLCVAGMIIGIWLMSAFWSLTLQTVPALWRATGALMLASCASILALQCRVEVEPVKERAVPVRPQKPVIAAAPRAVQSPVATIPPPKPVSRPAPKPTTSPAGPKPAPDFLADPRTAQPSADSYE